MFSEGRKGGKVGRRARTARAIKKQLILTNSGKVKGKEDPRQPFDRDGRKKKESQPNRSQGEGKQGKNYKQYINIK